jgi:hypothetical protein
MLLALWEEDGEEEDGEGEDVVKCERGSDCNDDFPIVRVPWSSSIQPLLGGDFLFVFVLGGGRVTHALGKGRYAVTH